MSIEGSRIIFDRPSAIFYSGQTVTGKFELVTTKELNINAINFISKGRAKVSWTEGGGQNTRYYYANEKYFHNKSCMYGKVQAGTDTVTLQPGTYSYPFSFKLPDHTPCSFEYASVARVRYSVKAHIDIAWSRSKYIKRLFTVIRPLDLNISPKSSLPDKQTTQKNLCCLCCKSGPIAATVSVDRKGYVAGEHIPFRAEIQNGASRRMKGTSVEFSVDITCHAMWKTRTFHQRLSKLTHGAIQGGGSDVWYNERLPIPPVAPSFLQGCRIIDLSYSVWMTVDPAGPALDLDCSLPVFIGTVPLQSVAQQRGHPISEQPPEPVEQSNFGIPTGGYGQSETTIPSNIPAVTFEDSGMGPTKVKDDSAAGTTFFAPKYMHYKWDKPSLDSMFTVTEN